MHIPSGRREGGPPIKANPEAFPEALGDVGSICPVRVFHQSRFPDVWRERRRDQLQLLDRESVVWCAEVEQQQICCVGVLYVPAYVQRECMPMI